MPQDAPPSSAVRPDTPSIPIPPLDIPGAPAYQVEGERDAPAHPDAPPVPVQPEQAGAQENQQPPGPRVDAHDAPQAPAPPVPPPVHTPPPEPSDNEDSPPPRPAGRARHRRAASPAPEQPVRRSTRPHNAPGEWWKANYRRAQSTPSVGPTPEPSEPPEPEENDVEQVDDEQEIKQESSDEDEEESAARTHAGQRRPPPRTLKEALKRPDHAKWKEAADLEIQAHITNGTWEPCKLPAGRRAILCKWVFNEKFQADGTLERQKGRLVVKGCSQRPGFDYLPDKTY